MTAARLLADAAAGGEQRPRHALLAEAVAAELLPGERAAFHERVARALQAAGDDTFGAEVAGHWAAAGRAAEELPARVRAAEAAERVFGYAEAARHWQRAIELFEQCPTRSNSPAWTCRRCTCAASTRLGSRRAQRSARSPRRLPPLRRPSRPAVAAPYTCALAHRRWRSRRTAALPARAGRCSSWPIGAERAGLWRGLLRRGVRGTARRTAPLRAGQFAEAARSTATQAPAEAWRAGWRRGRGSGRERSCRGHAPVRRGAWTGQVEGQPSDARLQRLANACTRRRNAAEAMLARGRTAEAAQLIDPLTDEPASQDHYPVHGLRAEIDLLRGDVEARRHAAAADQVRHRPDQQRRQCPARSRSEPRRLRCGRLGPRTAWPRCGRCWPGYHSTDWTIQCGWLLAVGMRACAELAEQGRARRDESATQAALAAADELAAWVDRTAAPRSCDHPYVATIPAARATWDAERSRLSGQSDPGAWQAAADAWTALGCPHRAAYAGWRHAEARLLAGEPPAAVAGTIRDRRSRGGRACTTADRDPRVGRPRPHPTRHRASALAEPPADTGAVRADRTRVARAAAARGRSQQSRDRRGILHQPEDGQRSREQHPAQARLSPPAPRPPPSPNAPGW